MSAPGIAASNRTNAPNRSEGRGRLAPESRNDEVSTVSRNCQTSPGTVKHHPELSNITRNVCSGEMRDTAFRTVM